MVLMPLKSELHMLTLQAMPVQPHSLEKQQCEAYLQGENFRLQQSWRQSDDEAYDPRSLCWLHARVHGQVSIDLPSEKTNSEKT